VTLADAKDIATVLGAIVAVGTLIKGITELSRQNALKRAEHFQVIRQRLKNNSTFKDILDLVERNDPTLRTVPFKDKRDLLGLFEEIALMLNSRLIRREVAHYMFGYYALRCYQSDDFWSDV
jgi:hypothetical protein